MRSATISVARFSGSASTQGTPQVPKSPDAVIDRLCLKGPVDYGIRKIALAFSVYRATKNLHMHIVDAAKLSNDFFPLYTATRNLSIMYAHDLAMTRPLASESSQASSSSGRALSLTDH